MDIIEYLRQTNTILMKYSIVLSHRKVRDNMADIELVVKIPESEIPKQQEVIEIPLHFIDGKVCEAGGYGFDVLPKGHGRLIDENQITKLGVNFVNHHIKTDAPTIIEADKENKE